MYGYAPRLPLDPPALLVLIAILMYSTAVLTCHDICKADIYQDQILAFGTICAVAISDISCL